MTRAITHAQRGRRRHVVPWQRKHAAYHEAGHAVIGLAAQLPVAYARSVPNGRTYFFMVHERNSSIGRSKRQIGGRYKATVGPKAAELDAFGNPPQKTECTPREHHAEIVMCLAGPMAEAKLRNQDWRGLASSSDMNIARHHRAELGAAAESWKEYEQEAAALVTPALAFGFDLTHCRRPDIQKLKEAESNNRAERPEKKWPRKR
jgi:hypothetical protein